MRHAIATVLFSLVLLAFCLLFGWFGFAKWAEYEASENREAAEQWQGYERCVVSADMEYYPNPVMNADDFDALLEARRSCLSSRLKGWESNSRLRKFADKRCEQTWGEGWAALGPDLYMPYGVACYPTK